MEPKCDSCGCDCGGETGVCPHTGAAQVQQPGIFSTVSQTAAKYSSRWMQGGTPGTFDSSAGENWMSASMPVLSRCQPDEIAVVFDLCTAYWFTESAGSYIPRFGAKQHLVFDHAVCRFLFTDCDGTVWQFTNTGEFHSVQYQDARETEVTERTPNGQIQKIAHTTTQNGKTTVDANVFEYDGGGRIKQVTFQRSTNPTAGIRRIVYAYYGVNEEHGSNGDLKTATEQLLVGTTWVDHETSYYRYYKAGEPGGFEHGLKFAFSPEAFERFKADPQVADPFLATDAQAARFADQYYEYDAQHRVTKSVVQAGRHTFTYSYATSSHGNDYNHWKLKVTVTRPDGSQQTTYNNFIGQTLLTDLTKDGDHWLEYHQYDSQAREVLHASPAAVVSYDDTQADLGVVLNSTSGRIDLTDYYTITTATPTTPGGAAGYVQFRKVQQGTTGTAITLSETKYFKRVTAGTTIYPVAESTTFRNDDETGAITTSYAYTWFEDTAQIQQRTTTLPVVPVDQNGTGSTDTITEIFDEDGHLVWQRDARGFITYRAYDLPTGAVVRQIQDVDGAKLALPDGWFTPPGGGLHLVTDFEHDALGRTTQTLGPPHDVSGQTVRAASWTVYRDLENETYSGQGYAVGSEGEYQYTLVNPVSIARTSPDGRVRDSIVAVRGCSVNDSCDCLVPEAGLVDSAGRLSAQDCFPQSSWVRWSRTLSNDQGQVISSRTYHRIPADGTGLVGVDYDETRFGYDVMGRQNRTVSPAGTISRTVFDVHGLVVSTWIGTDDTGSTDADPTGGGATGNNMVVVAANEYDNGSDGGNGNLTKQTDFVDASTTRVTTFQYDFRDRHTVTDGEEDFYQVTVYDNLDQIIRVDRRDTSAGGNLIGRSETKHDNRGRVYRTIRYAVDPATGVVGNSLVDNTFYDASGNVIESRPAGSKAFTTNVFDGVGRPTAQYVGYVGSGTSSTSSTSSSGGVLAGDVIFEQSETVYDAAGNVTFVTRRQRFHDATGTGPLQGPSGWQPKSRDSYVAMWHDGIGRSIASADYGTNDNLGPPQRPAEPPESSDTVLVSRVRYNARGEAFETVDAAGVVNRTEADAAGRTVRTIKNYVANEGCFCPEAEENLVTEMRYDLGRFTALVAKNAATGDQVTRYEYGVTLADSDLASNDLLRAEIYPAATDSTDRFTYTYNRQGQRKRMRDPNGSIHDYEYDLLGRPVGDAVVTLADGVDGTVRRIGQAYDVRGMVRMATSYGNVAGTSVVNEVQNEYNDFAQLQVQYQEHAGSVNTGTTPKVQYDYADGSTNTIRPVSMTYPNGRVLDYLYDNIHADKLSHIRTLRWDGVNVCRYGYLGLGTFVTTDYLQPQVKLDYARGHGANPYTGFDRFGRIVDLLWAKYGGNGSSSSSSSGGSGNALVHLQYGYDRSSNRTYRRDEVARSAGKSFDELYEYDQLNQLKKFHRGWLVGENRVIESPGLQQGWQFDATGNWVNFTQFDPAHATKTLDQQRLHNQVNEITDIARTVGANWATPDYDRNGNMLSDEVGRQFTYDAWNRLTMVKDAEEATLKTYRYDALSRRVRDDDGSETTDLYYSDQWQVLEERVAGEVVNQYVWSLTYIDAMILRDRATATPGVLDERLWVTQDANWNVVGLVDGNGAVVERYAYDPYGSTEVLDVNWNVIGSAYGWIYLHQGGRWDTVSGLYYFRNRDYSPTLGRWVTRDPIGYATGDSNLYRYVGNRPINRVDPSGLLDPGTGTVIVGGATTAGGVSAVAATGVGVVVVGGGYVGYLGYQFWEAWGSLSAAEEAARQLEAKRQAVLAASAARAAAAAEAARQAAEQAARKPPLPPVPPKGPEDCEPKCKPCIPPVGSIAYRVDLPPSPAHNGIPTPHSHKYVMMQSPPRAGCKCFWKEVLKDPLPGILSPPITPAGGGGIAP